MFVFLHPSSFLGMADPDASIYVEAVEAVEAWWLPFDRRACPHVALHGKTVR